MSKLLKIIAAALAALLASALPIGAAAAGWATATMPAASLSIAPLEAQPPGEYQCAALILMEPESGQIIFEKNADARREVASITKIMSILLTIEALEDGRIALTDDVAVSKNAAGMGGSQALLDVGEVQTVGTLLKCAIVASANDATVALAEHIAGSVPIFVDRMNERAGQLGMADTHFVNTTGLPAEGQYTTARDVARMAMALVGHE
ncbi:MAG: D-alanyl-D-alanine carboxypeptidase, partial [Clostridiales bacterium]|nr:D-alanyl-D-alanine carboxypeptidase [Clostridiales bacterium]